MTSGSWRLFLAWRAFARSATLVSLLLFGCKHGDAIAELEKATGAVSRDHAKSVGSWEAAAPGAEFRLGDGVRSGASSRALLRLFDGSSVDLEPSSVIRFRDKVKSGKGAKLDVEMGQATLEAAGEAFELEMSVGTARLEAHGKVRLSRNGDATRLEVMIGSARLLSAEETLELRVGDAIDIVKTGVVKVPPAGASASPAPAPSASLASPAPSSVPSAEAGAPALPGGRAAGPGLVDFVAGAGDSFVVHDPSPPTSIAFVHSGCAGELVLTLDPGKRPRETGGSGRVSAEIASGSHRYTVSCVKAGEAKGERLAEGSVAVFADAGSRKLARTAPQSTVDTDGRRYTVLYQSLLPSISVRWPNAPAAPSYTLRVSSSSGSRSLSSGKPTLNAGALSEGDHTLVFEGGGARSKQTSVAIRFDNAAPTASISSPADRSFGPSAAVLVSGSALPGWTVSAAGKDLAQDAQNRFSGEVSAPAAERALVIRFSHPSRGNHYYLRRSVR